MVYHRLFLYHLKTRHIIRSSECRFWDQEHCLQGFCGGGDERHRSGQGLGSWFLSLRLHLCPAQGISFLGTATVLLG